MFGISAIKKPKLLPRHRGRPALTGTGQFRLLSILVNYQGYKKLVFSKYDHVFAFGTKSQAIANLDFMAEANVQSIAHLANC